MTAPPGSGGNPNSFVVPCSMKSRAATIRRTLNIRLGQGGLAGSNIDIVMGARG
jgi:hypothetical protein